MMRESSQVMLFEVLCMVSNSISLRDIGWYYKC